jgi:hypothetical protein
VSSRKAPRTARFGSAKSGVTSLELPKTVRI